MTGTIEFTADPRHPSALIADARAQAAWFRKRSDKQHDYGRVIHGGDCLVAADWIERLADAMKALAESAPCP